jgi:Flp pilus assembly protein CpaB
MVALLLAGLSAALSYALLSRSDESSSGGGGGGGGEAEVVVARVPISERTLITDDMLDIVNTDHVAVGAFTTREEVVGKVTKYPIEVNQQVITSAVVDTTGSVSNAELALVVPLGKRAMSIGSAQVTTAGGLILPGDWVDIVWGCCSDRPVVTKTILKNVQVAAVAQTIVSSGPVTDATPGSGESTDPVAADAPPPIPDAATITLLLTPLEVQQLFLAERTGQLRADLRGPSDTDTPDAGTTLITDLLPEAEIARLLEGLKPDGYRREQ